MKWTTTTPTKDGIYWYRNLCVGNKPAKIIHFQPATEDDESLTFARFSDTSSHYESFRYFPDKGDEWSNTPIPEPGETL